MAMGDGSPLDISHVLRQSEFPQDRERHGRECLVDLHPFDVTEAPASASQRLPDCRHRTHAEHAGLNGPDAVRY